MKNIINAYMAKQARKTEAIKNFQNMITQMSRMRIPSNDTGNTGKAAATFCSYLIGSVGAAVITDALLHEMTGSHLINTASAAENEIPQKEMPTLLENMSLEQILSEDSMPQNLSNEFMTPNNTAYFSGKNTIYKIDFVGMGEIGGDIEANVTDLSLNSTAKAFLKKRGSNYDVEFAGNGSKRKVRISGHGFDGEPIKFAEISAYEVSNNGPESHYNKTIKISGNRTAWQRIKENDRLEMEKYSIEYLGKYDSGNTADKLKVTYGNRTAEVEINGRNKARYISFEESPDTLIVGGNSYYDERKGKRVFNLFAKMRPKYMFEDLGNIGEAERGLGLD